VVVTVASTSAVRRTGAVLRAAAVRIAVTAGLILLGCVFGTAVASAATSTGAATSADDVASTIQSDMNDLVTGLFGAPSPQHHAAKPAGGVAALQPPADSGDSSGSVTMSPVAPAPASSSGGGGYASPGQGSSAGSDSGSDSDDTWSGSTTVTVPTRTTPEAPAPPPAPVTPPPSPAPAHAQPTSAPSDHSVIEHQVPAPVESSMGAPTGAVPDLPRNPLDLPLQQPAAQPISSPSTTGTAGHDLGGANGIAAVTPPGTGFRPSPGSSTDEYSAKRVSDGVPGLPSTSPD
jgi:hypothetical protein